MYQDFLNVATWPDVGNFINQRAVDSGNFHNLNPRVYSATLGCNRNGAQESPSSLVQLATYICYKPDLVKLNIFLYVFVPFL